MDEAVWRFIRESLQDDDLREGIIQSDRQSPPDVAETKRQLAMIDADLQRLNRQIDKWLSAFGSDADAELAAKVEGNIRDARRKIIEQRQKREELATEPDRRAETLLRRREIYERISKMQRKLDRATSFKVVGLTNLRCAKNLVLPKSILQSWRDFCGKADGDRTTGRAHQDGVP